MPLVGLALKTAMLVLSGPLVTGLERPVPDGKVLPVNVRLEAGTVAPLPATNGDAEICTFHPEQPTASMA